MQLRRSYLSQEWVLFITFIVLLISIFLLQYPVLRYSTDNFIYPQDEAYMRMSIGKNIAYHGIWGLSPAEFSSASSSILYPLLLAGIYKLVGTHLIIPFLINLICAIVCILVLKKWLVQQGLNALNQLIVLLNIILLTPIPILVVSGTEHMLQVLLVFLFLFEFSKQLTANKPLPWHVYLLGALFTATRYEGLFIILIACIMLLTQRRWLQCLLFGSVSITPVILFGLYAVYEGGFFLPTSIMIKALPIPLDGDAVWKFLKDEPFMRLFYPSATHGTIAVGRILIILPLVYWLFHRRIQEKFFLKYILLFCLGASILHLVFANAAFFHRYEAYLIASFTLIFGTIASGNMRNIWVENNTTTRWLIVWSGIFLLYPFCTRAWSAFKDANVISYNMYEQGYQAAGFIHQYYNESTVIVDDIGVVSYFSEGKKMDLSTGIGYTEIARSKEENYERVDYINFLINKEKPSLAVILENKYTYDLIKNWVKVADWFAYDHYVLRSDHISFYALDSASAPDLKRKLQAYQPSLPATVRVVYY